MAQPINVRVVVVQGHQNPSGEEILRFTADYLVADVFAVMTSAEGVTRNGTPASDDDIDDLDFQISLDSSDAHNCRPVDLRKATDGVALGCLPGDPGWRTLSLDVEPGEPPHGCSRLSAVARLLEKYDVKVTGYTVKDTVTSDPQ